MRTMTIREVINEVENLNGKINEWYGKLKNSVSTEDRNICREYITSYQKQRDEFERILDKKIIVDNN